MRTHHGIEADLPSGMQCLKSGGHNFDEKVSSPIFGAYTLKFLVSEPNSYFRFSANPKLAGFLNPKPIKVTVY